LSVSNTNLSGEIPFFIGNMRKLSELNLSKCGFSGTIFSSLLNLTKLVQIDQLSIFPEQENYLDFSSIKFSSFITQDIGNYLSLTSFLSVSNNTLDGSIPNSIYIASSLQVFDLSLDNIYGTIISCLMRMSGTLKVLNLKNNNLTGHIPDAIPASCSLWILNLHGNLLVGPIPNSLLCCLKLKVLDLGINQIIGGFPCFLKKISTLRILVLWKNKFQGSLRCLKTNKGNTSNCGHRF
ncbi:Receptor-like protein 12, partial [Glycine soja]